MNLTAISDITFSPDGSTIAATTSSGFGGTEIFLISAASDKPLTQFQESDAARPTFSPDGTTIATQGADGTILLWDTR